MVCAIQEVLMVCYPYAQLTAVYTSLTHYFVLASRAPSITITLNALPITMVATEKPRSPGSPPPTILPCPWHRFSSEGPCRSSPRP
mgnify:CR=1 FL=1